MWRRGVLLAAGVAIGAREIVGRLRAADLRGQVALVTGGSRGLGFLLARELVREGCRVAICARDEEEIARARADLRRLSDDVQGLPCDVSDRAQVDALVADVTRHFGRIDILVNNAGIIQVGPLADMTHRDFEETLGVMLWGIIHPTLAVLPQMRARHGGRIVNITSIGGKISVPHLVPYCTAKFAAVGLSEGLRAELARDGITVTTVVPGLMRTGSYLNALFKGRQEEEFTLFSLGATLPLISMDAERAARQIVRAVKRGEAEPTLSLPAVAAARLVGLAPGLTADIAGLANRLLPEPDGA
ncbi:MAG: SDR family oxidoreductase, partial [Thermomicrobiaceae bacterium]|nr:SDR family oxidoreductase [Thermomicrobiaceae bacterium]